MEARREVGGPVDAVTAARALASERAWFWYDGWDGRSHLGAADEVVLAELGREREFLAGLREADGFGGWAVALGYEFGAALLGLDPAPDEAAPAFALRVGTVLVIDHGTGGAELRGPSEAGIDHWLARYSAALASPPPDPHRSSENCRNSESSSGVAPRYGNSPSLGKPRWRSSAADYLRGIEACRAHIQDGDAYVLCLTDTAEVRLPNADPLELYLRLRESGPTTRGGVIVAGDRVLASASPERFLSVEDGHVQTHPIKGTRPRGDTPEADAAFAAELAADPKEQAENLMIVDLMRNDLSRVSVPGTVATTGFLRVESHPHVHQLVSTVSGRLAAGRDAIDAIEACFPGGSMTGAPKRRAVEILAEVEQAPRGLYSGCFGWIERGGAELAMTIRSIELRDGVAHVGAGGGITADSAPERELAEKNLKAAPLLAALDAERAAAQLSAPGARGAPARGH